MSEDVAIEVRGARTHNLKGIDCRIPHGRVTVVTGPSGAGKSSLAFDTVFAEGQRRFVESMSTYARQFLERMERPPVDRIDHVLPAVALEAQNTVKNARSTVGTITEAYDVLRLLWGHLGEVLCPEGDDPEGHGPARRFTPEEAAAEIAAGQVGDRAFVVVPLPRPKRGANAALKELVRQGFARRLDGEEVVRMTSSTRWTMKLDPLPLVLGRFKADGTPGSRLVQAVEEAYRLGRGQVEARGPGGVRHYSRRLGCTRCGRRFRRPTPALFSFNTPLGACETCQGFGRVIGVDRRKVIPDPTLSLEDEAVAPWRTPAYYDLQERMMEAAPKAGVPVDVPWEELERRHRAWVWSGQGDFKNLDTYFAWLERRSYKVHVRALLARYRSYDPCPDCDGTRLSPEARAVQVADRSLPEVTAWPIDRLRRWLDSRTFGGGEEAIASHLLEELAERLDVLCRVGLDYLTLDRQARTLSGGETQRIHLAAALGSGLTSTLYVLDEPTVGLHPVDSEKLVGLLGDLAARGNTVLVVEHDRTLIEGADWVIDLGPRAGESGGELLAEGPLERILESERSLTGAYLGRRPHTDARRHLARHRRERGRETVEEEIARRPRAAVRGATAHNLVELDVEFPLASLVAVTGVSGSGKSTLVENVIYGNLKATDTKVDVEPGPCRELEGFGGFADTVLVDQRALGRSTRSNPVTYVKAYDEIRKLFAKAQRARFTGITAGHFSFNLDLGRCPECKGTGVVEIDMQFMAPVTVVCEACRGRRFRRKVLAVEYKGLNIHQTLELTVDQALERFSGKRRLTRKLQTLADAGLGYLRLGQPTATLSGGEAQRLKLASFLGQSASSEPILFLFDEPTTGLHMSDIELLAGTLRRLVQRGHTVVVVEHSLDLVARVDWVIDLGPGGGVDGGRLLHSGPLGSFVEEAEGATADELRRYLGRRSWSPSGKAPPGKDHGEVPGEYSAGRSA